jgi:hypothetical protein
MFNLSLERFRPRRTPSPTARPIHSAPIPFSDLCVLPTSPFSSLPSPSVRNMQTFQLSTLPTSPRANSHRIRTSPKHTPNPFRIRSSKTKDLKPFIICTYRKTGEGVPFSSAALLFLRQPSAPDAARFVTSLLHHVVASTPARRNPRNFNLFMSLLHNSRTPRGRGSRRPSVFSFQLLAFSTHYSLLTTHFPLLTSHPLKPPLQMAHPYLCTCKKGPAAREPRYSPCAAS